MIASGVVETVDAISRVMSDALGAGVKEFETAINPPLP